MPVTLSNEKFISKSSLIHGDRYDYTQTIYNGSHNTVTIVCLEHGPFTMKAYVHLRGQGCPHCAIDRRRMSGSDFIKKARMLYQGRYLYTNVPEGFTPIDEEITVTCIDHGDFTTTRRKHMKGQGCPFCKLHYHGIGMVLLG